MFLFGHLGVTLGAALVASGAYGIISGKLQKAPPTAPSPVPGQPEASHISSLYSPITWLKRLNTWLNIRVLLFGSILPDIIDKPVGQYFFDGTFHNGRIFSHTLVFFLVLAIAGCWLFQKKKRNWLLVLAGGVLAHLILDQMWLTPHTLFWPFLGWKFPVLDKDAHIISVWLNSLVNEPSAFIPEIIGFMITVAAGIWLWKNKGGRR